MRVTIEIAGSPAPKGSARAIMRGGHAILVGSGSNVNRDKLKSWDQDVRLAANQYAAGRSGPIFVDVPLFVFVVFRLTRPVGHWGKAGGLRPSAPAFPTVKPDLDKLVRATMDSLKGTIYDDDARIVAKAPVKVYATPGREGATIVIEPITGEILRHLGVEG